MISNPDLRLNFIPVTFEQNTFTGYEIAFEDKEQLQELRKKHRNSYVFRRNDSIIQCIPLNEKAQSFGMQKQFNIADDFSLAKYLIQDVLIKFFQCSSSAKISQLYNPTRIVLIKENLIKDVLDQEAVSLISMYPEYQIEAKLLVPDDKKVTFGVLVNFGVRHLIQANIRQLIGKKIDVLNRYIVTNSDTNFNLEVAPQFTRNLAGRIVAIEGDRLQLEDFRDNSIIDADKCFLEPSTRNFIHCLRALSNRNKKEITESRMRQIFKVTGAKNQYERLEKLQNWLSQKGSISCTHELSFRINSEIYQPKPGNEAGEYRRLENPSYILRPGGSIPVEGKIDDAIDKHGPYDTESFPNKKIRIAYVYPERFQGDIEGFIRQFKDGVPPIPNKNTPYTQGFVRKYRLISCEFKPFPVGRGSENSSGYKKASLEALGSNVDYDVAIIFTREDWHALRGDNSPYLVAKSAFMSQGVPVQSVEIETVQDKRGRPWILNNLALAVYAKLEGIPWVLSPTPGMTHELIFGIGSSITRTKRLGESERFVGITTVFNGQGDYLLYNLTKEVQYEDYQDALLQSLEYCLNQVKARELWQPNDKVRLIFHQTFKKFKDIEAQTVKQFVDSIADFDVEYAFVHISKKHSWKLFDKNSQGTDCWENYEKRVKGEYVPYRGFYLPLGPKAALLTLTGSYQLKTSMQGCPEPILVSIHDESTFESQEYLVNQVYKLTFMSWRSFFPSTTPVTVEYSNLIADLMSKLRTVTNWNPDVLNTKFRESRWFL